MSQDANDGASSKDLDKLGALFWRHGPEALRLAFLLTGNRAVAEDVVQDAFVRVAGRFQEILRPEGFGAYLKRTVINLTRDHFRRVRRDRDLLQRHSSSLEVHVEAESQEIIARAEILQALHALPYRQRAAVVLRYCEGLSEREVAEVLDTSVAAAKSLAARGLQALRKGMEGMSDDER